jgi:outer membrane protein assembly factor BamA
MSEDEMSDGRTGFLRTNLWIYFFIALPALTAVSGPPRISSVGIEGNTMIPAKKLLSTARPFPSKGQIFDPETVTNAIAGMRARYLENGYAECRIACMTNSSTDRFAVRFAVSEGPRFEILAFVPVGFSLLKTNALRSILKIGKTRKAAFNSVGWETGLARIRRKYLDSGYFSVRLEPRIETNSPSPAGPRLLVLRLDVREGPVFGYSGIRFNPPDPPVEKLFLARRTLHPDRTFHFSRFTNDLSLARQILEEQDHPFPRISIATDLAGHSAAFSLSIDRGPIPVFAGLRISGLAKTRTNIVTRENGFFAGERFKYGKRQEFLRALQDLRYFRDISITTVGSNGGDLFFLDLILKEQQTGMIILGATFGIDELGKFKPGGYEEIVEYNFLGRGLKIAERIELNTRGQFYAAALQTPRLLRHPLKFNLSPFYSDKIAFNSASTSVNAQNRYRIRNTGVVAGTLYRRSDGFVASCNLKISAFKGSGDGWALGPVAPTGRWHMKNSLFLQAGYLKVDEPVFPRRGVVLQQTWIMTGGLLGGIPDFNKWITDVQFYGRIAKFLDVAVKANIGTVSANLIDGSGLIFGDDFFNIRSPSYGFVGGTSLDSSFFSAPECNVRSIVPADRQVGLGKTAFNFELRVPVSRRLVSLVGFIDAGNIWDGFGRFDFDLDHYYFLVGGGFKLDIPMLPLQIYWSKRFKGLSFRPDTDRVVFDVNLLYSEW